MFSLRPGFNVPSFAIPALLCGVLASGCHSDASGPGDPAAKSASTTTTAWSGKRQQPVTDAGMNMTAFTVNTPDHWSFLGMILRFGGCHSVPFPAAGLAYTALAPDGVTASMRTPGVSWSWASDGTSPTGPKCQPIPIDTAAGFLLNIAIPNMHPDAQVVGLVPLKPQVQKALDAQRAQMNAGNRGVGGAASGSIMDGAQVRIKYTMSGRPVEELLSTVLTCNVTHEPAMPFLHRAERTKRLCNTSGTAILRAPEGHLDALIDTPPVSVDINPDWDNQVIQRMRANFAAFEKASNDQFQAMEQHFAAVHEQQMAQGRQFQDMLRAQTNNAMALDAQRQGAIDNAAHQTALFALDRQTFVNPQTGQRIEASSQFNHQWIGSDGDTLIQTNDHTLNPNGVVDPYHQTWTELQPTF